MRGKKLALFFAALALLITGVLILIYPAASNNAYRDKVKALIDEFDLKMEKQTGQADELYLKALEYNRGLYREQPGITDPFFFEDVDFSLIPYGFEDEMIGYLTIPGMDLQLPVYLGASQENMKLGAAHLSHTSIPIGGQNHNSVIAAHRGMTTAKMFKDIEKLEAGDLVYLTNFRETLVYSVAEIEVILPDDVESVYIKPGRDLITLLTCHPSGSNTHRYLVICEREDNPPEPESLPG